MLQFPRWRVDVTVGGDLVKTFYETATTSAAAIAKAKHKMRGAVSSAGAFRFKATKAEGESKSQHATKKKSPSQLQREIDEVLAKKPGEGGPRILKISPAKTFAGQRSITANVQYPGEPPSRVEFVGPSVGGAGPVVMISRGHQTFVTDPSRFGGFGPEWVRRFFESA